MTQEEEEEEERRWRRQKMFWSQFSTVGLLDPEADEVLLGLLARDNEPPPKHDKPHRRWVQPPTYHDHHGHYDWDAGIWSQTASDWWKVTPRKTHWAEEEARWRKEALKRELLAFVRYRLPQRRPVAEWLDQWLVDPRHPDRRFPDKFFTRRGPWF